VGIEVVDAGSDTESAQLLWFRIAAGRAAALFKAWRSLVDSADAALYATHFIIICSDEELSYYSTGLNAGRLVDERECAEAI